MKKKKQRTSQPPPTTLASADIKYLIRKNSSFFDNLIQLIPAKFYLPTEDDSKPYFPGLNKSAKLAAKQQTRDNIKKSRRDRLDPEKKPLTSTLDLLKQTLRPVPGPTEDGRDGAEPVGNPDRIPERSVTYEELRQRLHRRIEELRGNRGGGEAWRSEKREKRENEYRKRKRGGCGSDDDDDDQAEGEKSVGRGGNIRKSEGEIEKEVTEASKRIEFGKVKLGGGGEERNKKKKKLSKEKELEMAKRLEEAKKDPGVAKKHSWKAAVSRAAGDKVHDDPKLLKVSMSKEKRRHEKNAEKWKDRVESREKVKGEKQQKRAGNIAERIHQKKMRKIAKREKKLMRPGFEGRKEGYINEN
ncbi:ribosomal RNA-processing protein 14-like [Rhododendron vialii]|uniref:ribosomal RNA-processing protein 14-like n=1 Tax=Rhododendron vialii TaxID=182163 RepID=UPI00265FA14A|nr:ribosomal RNA-processing protein 14-like [Rhododendron vialii]